MNIPSKKRLEFERLLKELGYVDRSPVLDSEEKTEQVNFKCSSGSMAIYTFIDLYQNKKSYLWIEFLDNYKENNLKEKISDLAKRIRFEEKTQLAEVGYKAKYTKNPDQFSLEERKNILLHFIGMTHNNLRKGMLNIYPQPGMILVAKPLGPKIDQGFTELSLTTGKRQRSIVAKKLGFGDLKPDGFQYARYDEDCILRSI